jgi:transcriptional regulator with XRE-family HTH domain
MRTNLPTAMRSLRIRAGWRQDDLAQRAGLTRDVVSRAENGELDGITTGSLRSLAEALGATLVLELRWRGADLDRLVDRVHARLQAAAAARVESSGWTAYPEVAFNHYGDRGSCDIVAWHAASQILMVVEVKSRIGNIQDLLRQLDIKARLGYVLAQQVGLPRPRAIVRALVMPDERSPRRVIAAHEPLFRGFPIRGRAAFRWLQQDATVHAHERGTQPGGLIWFENPANSGDSRTKSVERVRKGLPAGSRPQ